MAHTDVQTQQNISLSLSLSLSPSLSPSLAYLCESTPCLNCLSLVRTLQKYFSPRAFKRSADTESAKSGLHCTGWPIISTIKWWTILRIVGYFVGQCAPKCHFLPPCTLHVYAFVQTSYAHTETERGEREILLCLDIRVCHTGCSKNTGII